MPGASLRRMPPKRYGARPPPSPARIAWPACANSRPSPCGAATPARPWPGARKRTNWNAGPWLNTPPHPATSRTAWASPNCAGWRTRWTRSCWPPPAHGLRDAASGHHVLLVLARESWILRAVGALTGEPSYLRRDCQALLQRCCRACSGTSNLLLVAGDPLRGTDATGGGPAPSVARSRRQARMSAASSPRPRIAARPAPSPRTAGHRSRPAIAAPAFSRSRRPRPSRSRWPGRRRAPARDGAAGHEPAGNRNEWAICPCRARRARPACLPSRPPAWTAAALAPRTSAARPGRRRGRRPDPGSPPGIRPECATAPDLLQQCHHALAVRAEQDRQRQFLQQLHGSRAPIAGVRHQAGHVAQFRDARAPQPSGPAATDDQRGNGLVHHQPGRLESGQPDLTAITHQGDVVIEVFEPIAVPAGRLRGGMDMMENGSVFGSRGV